MARTEPELTDAQWARLVPLLPPQRPATGRPNNDHRQVVEAMVWLVRTGAPWRDLPADQRRGRDLGGPTVRAACSGNPSLAWLPPRVVASDHRCRQQTHPLYRS